MLKISGNGSCWMPAGLRSFAVVFLAMAFGAVLLSLGSEARAQSEGEPEYTITDLGTLGGSDSRGNSINSSGHVVGYSSTDNDGPEHAFLYKDGTMTDLHTLGGSYSFGYGVDDDGQVVGSSYIAGDSRVHAFLYDETNGMRDLGTLPGYIESDAYDVNGSGRAVGVVSGSGYHAVLYEGGTITDLGTLGGPGSGATGINDSGHVVGYSYTDSGSWAKYRAFLYKDGVLTNLGVLDGSSNSQATDINDEGQVVGSSQDADFTNRASLWENGAVREIGGLPGASSSYAASINNSGQVVGSSEIPSVHEEPPPDEEIILLSHESKRHAFVWKNGQTRDLNDLIDPASGWSLESASDINDKGQIVGTGTISGQSHAFLLTPNAPADATAPTTTATPSPAPNAAGWNNSDVTVTLSATDDEGGTGVKEITYSLKEGTPTTVQGDTAQVSVTTEGETKITYFAKDDAGNTEAEKTLVVKLDKTAPSGTVLINGDARNTSKSTVKLTLSATDSEGGSGVESMRFSNDGTNWSEWEPYATTKSWTLARGKGTRTVYADFRDGAGNSVVDKDTIRRR